MRTSVIVLVVVLFAATSSIAQVTGQIGVFADANATDCNVNDNGGTLTVYAVHVNHEGAGAVDFMVQGGGGFLGTGIADTHVFGFTFGTSPDGVSVVYGSCQPAPTHVLTITYQLFGLSSPCSLIEVVANPNLVEPMIATTLCNESFKRRVTPKNLVVNPDGACDCTVPVRPVTWGNIKALYSAE